MGISRWIAVGVAVAIAGGIAYFARTAGDAASCTLSVPAELAVDAPALEFTATTACTHGASPDVTWTASLGAAKTSELRFQRTDSAVTEVYSTDPLGRWTWKVTRTNRSGVTYNEPVTEVRARSTVTVSAEQLGQVGTVVTFHVRRYDVGTGTMKPWPAAVGRIESRIPDTASFKPASEITSDKGGNVVLTLRPSVDQQYRVTFSTAGETFGTTSDHVYVSKAQ